MSPTVLTPWQVRQCPACTRVYEASRERCPFDLMPLVTFSPVGEFLRLAPRGSGGE